MTEGGTSKKLTIGAVGIAAELALVGSAESSILTYVVAVAIAVITLYSINRQAALDHKGVKEVINEETTDNSQSSS